ncbi:hypothetical protein [Croceicoccus mobilis]|uniref:hypothetical protein n=1 Tax=Croceicoccus mobilis TaxID=1703339 RepID=UPI000A87BE09|nr:hypothetical protein [Croceicoccus mobilis]
MKKLLSVTIAASLLVVPGQLLAKDDQAQPIVVERSITAEQWSKGVTTRLDRNLRVMGSLSSAEMSDGIIQIRFDVVGGDATNIRMVRSSDRPYLDSLARLSVKRLKDLPKITGSDERQPVLANIIVARDVQSFDRLSEELALSERARMASGDPAEHAVIALNMASPAG